MKVYQILLELSAKLEQIDDKISLLSTASEVLFNITESTTGYLYLRSPLAEQTPGTDWLTCRYHLHQSMAVASQNGKSAPPPPHPQPGELLQAEQKATVLQISDCCLLVPFHRRRRVLAILILCRESQQPFQEKAISLAQELSVMLDFTLQKQQMSEAHTTLANIAPSLSAEMDLDDLLSHIIQSAAYITYAQASSILLLQPDRKTLRFVSVFGSDMALRETLRQVSVPIEGSLAGSVVQTGQPLISNQTEADPEWFSGVKERSQAVTTSLLAVPLKAQNQIIGALEVINQKYGDGFDQADLEILTFLASQAAIAIQNARLLSDRQASLTEMKRLEQRKSQFIALASHELRTPLNLVMGYATLLRDFLNADSPTAQRDAEDCLEQIEQAASRLASMVSNITSLYNLETGRTQLILESCEVLPIVRRAMDEYQPWSRRKGIEMVLESEQPTWRTICDAIEFTRIIDSLLNNAIKFTPEGGKVTVSITATNYATPSQLDQPPRPGILFCINDTGPGIAEDQMDIIFERFSQVDNHLNRQQGGIGLGLPLAKSLVERHGGELWVESVVGQGSKFYFTLPV
jgi:signal transduction histidine kinase